MKLIIRSAMTILVLVSIIACSKEEPQPEPAKTTATPDITRTQTGRINDAQKTLDNAKQVNQAIQDSATQQRETIEKTQQ